MKVVTSFQLKDCYKFHCRGPGHDGMTCFEYSFQSLFHLTMKPIPIFSISYCKASFSVILFYLCLSTRDKKVKGISSTSFLISTGKQLCRKDKTLEGNTSGIYLLALPKKISAKGFSHERSNRFNSPERVKMAYQRGIYAQEICCDFFSIPAAASVYLTLLNKTSTTSNYSHNKRHLKSDAHA